MGLDKLQLGVAGVGSPEGRGEDPSLLTHTGSSLGITDRAVTPLPHGSLPPLFPHTVDWASLRATRSCVLGPCHSQNSPAPIRTG